MKVCLGEKTRHATVAIEKGVNPHQAMMGGSGGNQLQRAMMPFGSVKIAETIEKRRD